tara:strand:+ start:1846 stop:2046 length:201 start_codon:yes stop_codon:yes gene_type:complete
LHNKKIDDRLIKKGEKMRKNKRHAPYAKVCKISKKREGIKIKNGECIHMKKGLKPPISLSAMSLQK